ncbi:MAG TPA: hypothetical protein VM328_03710 [Fimbriimonadaceae bacterium]|nr:hypothetical protein [Fimbriimonadaceae bacterium]
MLPALALAILSPAYSFSPIEKLTYHVQVTFEGFIPVLGGQTGVVQVDLGLDVLGAKADGDAQLAAVSELSAFKIQFNGATLPFTLENVQGYFPKNTVQITRSGKVLRTDAPDVQLPVRLPGLDAKRFPDITFLPVEFPEGPLTIGKTFQYRKNFGGSDAFYDVTPVAVKDDVLELDIRMKQEYEVLEDDAVNVVQDEKDAVARVSTKLSGTGKAFFDLVKGRLDRMEVGAVADSTAVEIRSGKSSLRKLKTTLKVDLKKP